MKKDFLMLLGLALMVAAGKLQQHTTSKEWWFIADYARDLGTLLIGSRAVASIKAQQTEKKEAAAAAGEGV